MISQKQKMKQQQKLTPQQLLLMRLLQLPVTSLEQRLKEEVEKNPMLEIERDEETDNDNYSQSDNQVTAEHDETQDDFNGIDLDDYFDDDDYSYRERIERDRNNEEKQIDYGEGTSFTESLLRQLGLRTLSERDRTIGIEIIGSIDGSGYLGRDIQLIANDMSFRSGIIVDDDEIERVLKIIQTFDPAGVGARTLQECLSLQLHRIANPDSTTKIATTIVDNYFSQLGNRHYASLTSALKISNDELNKAIATIRRLNPKPGWGREEENKGAHYIIPDFIVSHEGDSLSFSLSRRNSPTLHLNSDYSDMLQELSTRKNLNKEELQTVQFIKSNTESAQWLIDAVTTRQNTLATTMEAILKYQQAFFLSGDKNDLRPMRLKDIAAMTGFDESTISRVVNEKYVQTSFGTFLLKELFSKAVVTEQGDLLATEHIKQALRKVIDNEDKSNPLTDEELTAKLKSLGFNLSRRTVSKYRESMDIPVGRLRKEI